MNILFFLEPSIELGNPEFRYATLRSSIVPQVAALRQSHARMHTVISEVIADRALRDGYIPTLGSISTIDPIAWTNGENTLERSLRHQRKKYKEGEISHISALIKSGFPEDFDPDLIIVWESPMSCLNDIFPKARILYQMPGFFSRPPFSSLVSFDIGLLEDSSSVSHSTDSTVAAGGFAQLREQDLRFLRAVSPTQKVIAELKSTFKKLILFPLQIDGYFMIDAVLDRRTQLDVLLDTLHKLPEDYGLIVTNYKSGQTQSAVLSSHNIKYLRSRFKNFIYQEKFDKVPSVSQFLVPEMDGVVTISSSLGYQAAFWEKPLFTIGCSHVSPFSTTDSWDEFLTQVSLGSAINHDNKIASMISTRHVPAQIMSEDGPRYAAWLKAVISQPKGNFPNWTEQNEDLVGTLASLRRETELLKQLGYSDQVRQESSMDHCLELSQQIPRYDIISFDIFDTLLYRPFKSPADMFDLMADRVRAICEQPSLDFRAARRSAEKAAFEAALARGEGETRLDEIYEAFAVQTGVSTERAVEVQALEMQMEMDILYPRLSGFKAFNEARSLGKRVILISDMYLSKDFLDKVLKKNGYEGYERFYVSSEIRLKKHNGKLFDYVINDLNVEPKTILHIGDNLDADVIHAKKRGIKPFHLVKASEIFSGCDNYKGAWARDEERHALDWKMILAVVGNRFHDNPYLPHRRGTLFCGDPWRLGYYGHGPLLLGYSKWLLEKARRDGVERLYFLSRDGLIMKEAYDRIAKAYPNAPSSHYLLCSRRAVNLAKVRDAHGVMDLLHVDYARTTLGHLLTSRFGVHAFDVPSELLQKHDLLLEKVISQKERESLKPFFLDLLPVIVNAAAKERESYLEYLGGTGLLDEGKVAVVDIGYAGTMQESLYLLTDQKKNFGGYYLMTFRQALKRVDAYDMPIRGYLGEFVDRHDTHHPFCRHVPLYETLFSSTDTSFQKMERDWNGRLRAVYMERLPAESRREQVVEQVHSGSLEFIEDVVKTFGHHLKSLDIEPNKSIRVLESFFNNPHPVDARIFSGVVFEDAYGGAGLKTILPEDNKLDTVCVWKKGVEARKRAVAQQSDTPKSSPKPLPSTPKNNVASIGIDLKDREREVPSSRVTKKIEQRAIRWLVKKTSNEKKFRKLVSTPHKFFADSKSRHVKLLGKIYLMRAT